MMKNFLWFYGALAVVLLFTRCQTNRTEEGKIDLACDTSTCKTYTTWPCGFGFCYPKNWETDPPNAVISIRVHEPLTDSTDTYGENFSVASNFTQNGYTMSMGNFKQYIDSSRKQLRAWINNIHFIADKDTAWYQFNAHLFEFSGELIGDSLLFKQLVIDANSYDQQFVLTFVQQARSKRRYSKIREDIFASFRLPEK